jgi:hypothetical protein
LLYKSSQHGSVQGGQYRYMCPQVGLLASMMSCMSQALCQTTLSTRMPV